MGNPRKHFQTEIQRVTHRLRKWCHHGKIGALGEMTGHFFFLPCDNTNTVEELQTNSKFSQSSFSVFL